MTLRPILILTLFALLALPAAASASPAQIFEDCQDGRLDRGYSGKDLRAALSDIPKDLDEYTNCREIIRSAQQGVRGPGGSGPTPGAKDAGGGSTDYGRIGMGDGGLPVGADKRQVDPLGFADGDERREIERARRQARAGVGTAPELVAASAGRSPGRPSDVALPTELIVLLVLTGGIVAAVTATQIKDLVRRRSA